MNYYQKNEELKNIYTNWLNELKQKHPELLGPIYSNPYYMSIPAHWYESKNRVLIVGEEGHGDWGCGKWGNDEWKFVPEDIEKIQTFNWSYLATNLKSSNNGIIEKNSLYPDAYSEEFNHSRFWNRARKIAEHEDTICAWTNADKIHRKKSLFKSCKLSGRERRNLHSLDNKILRQEIEVLNPSHVFFFGWRQDSFKTELPDVFEELYRKENDDWFYNDTFSCFEQNGIHYIFTKHPGARNLPGGYKVYEEYVQREFEHYLNNRSMKEITRYDIENCRHKYDEFIKTKMELYHVLIQPEYLDFFANSDNMNHTGIGENSGYYELAEKFKQNIVKLQKGNIGNAALYYRLVSNYHRTKNSSTVAYELIPDDVIAKLSADEIVSIYMGEIAHERWGGAFASLFEHPFFIKSLYRLKDILDEYDSSKTRHGFRI